MKKIFLIPFILCVLCLAVFVQAQDDSIENKKASAVIAAHNWLALIDEGDFSASWQEASSYFKNVVDQENWIKMIDGTRSPLGSILSRKLLSAKYSASLPGAPDGEYVVIQFSSSFEKKAEALETITPKLDQDGNWRISGYYIK